MAKTKIKRPRITQDIVDTVLELYWKRGLSPGLIKAALGKTSPSLRSIQNIIKKGKPIPGTLEFQELNQPWSSGSLVKYSVSSDSVPYILMVQGWAEKQRDIFKQPHEPLTIRQALWISRLYATVNITHMKAKDIPKVANWLWRWSEAYATREIICQLSAGSLETRIDTSVLDEAFRKGAMPLTVGKTTLTFYRDKSFLIDTADDNLLGQIKDMQKEGEQ